MRIDVLWTSLVAFAIVSTSGICAVGAQTTASQMAAPSVGTAAAVRRNAQENIPVGLIGAWQLDLSASSLGNNPPKNDIRIFDYTHDGMLLCTHLTLNSQGIPTSGNWTLSTDGAPGLEYTRPYGSTPYAVLTFKKIDDTAFGITDMRYGKVVLESTYRLEPDGNTLTISRETEGRKVMTVYRRWNTGK